MPFPSLPSPPTIFPAYLVPSIPFRRRQSSTNSTASSTSTTSTSPTAAPTEDSAYLSRIPASTLRCARCLSDLALSTQIISKGFTGRHGRAYLVSPSTPSDLTLPNTYTHKPVPRQLVTGAHTVGDISCSHCGCVLGWKYVAAEQEEQRYKVGKFILETKRVVRGSLWEDGTEDETPEADTDLNRAVAPADEVEFDSQDEDECDALFSGQWTPQFAKELRRTKKGRYRPTN